MMGDIKVIPNLAAGTWQNRKSSGRQSLPPSDTAPSTVLRTAEAFSTEQNARPRLVLCYTEHCKLPHRTWASRNTTLRWREYADNLSGTRTGLQPAYKRIGPVRCWGRPLGRVARSPCSSGHPRADDVINLAVYPVSTRHLAQNCGEESAGNRPSPMWLTNDQRL